MAIRLALSEFWLQKEKELGRRIFAKDVSEAIGVSRNTISAYLRNDVKRPDLNILNSLCKYFNVPPGPVPFVVYEPD